MLYNNEFEIIDVDGISRKITKHDELFDYVDTRDYLKEKVGDYADYEYEKDKYYFELGM